ncbi:unnamed protein product, partial [Effrenium voratum]
SPQLCQRSRGGESTAGCGLRAFGEAAGAHFIGYAVPVPAAWPISRGALWAAGPGPGSAAGVQRLRARDQGHGPRRGGGGPLCGTVQPGQRLGVAGHLLPRRADE